MALLEGQDIAKHETARSYYSVMKRVSKICKDRNGRLRRVARQEPVGDKAELGQQKKARRHIRRKTLQKDSMSYFTARLGCAAACVARSETHPRVSPLMGRGRTLLIFR